MVSLASHLCRPPPSIGRRRQQRPSSAVFYDGTAKSKSGNAMNYPETIGPDSHVDGPAPPVSTCEADVGYFVDGTAINAALKHDLPGAFAREARERISFASSQVCRGLLVTVSMATI